jgi:hypothetical protein
LAGPNSRKFEDASVAKVKLLMTLFLALCAVATCRANDITYQVAISFGGGTITGDIVTNGTIGTLSAADIVSWNIVVNDGSNMYDLTGLDSAVRIVGNDLSATSTQILFNFSGGDQGYFTFASPYVGAGGRFWEVVTANADGDLPSPGQYLSALYPDSGIVSDPGLSGEGTLGNIPGSITPEPSTLLLLATGLACLVGLTWRKLATVPPHGSTVAVMS